MAQTNDSKSKTLPQYVAALSANGSAFATGTLFGWAAPAGKSVMSGEHGFAVSANQFSWIGSSMALGGTCACIPSGFLISFIGCKLTMLLLVLPFTVGWCLMIWAQNVTMMYAARFILGISGGAFCVTAPIYTGEIAQTDIRGTLGSFFHLMLTSGVLFSYIVGARLDAFGMSIVCGIIPIVFGAIFLFMPETPTYLVSKNKLESAVQSIQWLRGKDYDFKSELEELKATNEELIANSGSIFAALTRRATLKAMFISSGLMFFLQFAGINAVIFYSTQIFTDEKSGLDPKLSTILVGVFQVITTSVSVVIVDKLGRRILLLISCLSLSLTTIVMGVAESVQNLNWLPVFSLCVFITMFSLGFGPVPWLMLSELFASDIKSLAASIVVTFNFILIFVITKSFVNLNEILGKGETFWLFSGITIIGVFFIYFIVPETKGKSLNEIQRELEGEK